MAVAMAGTVPGPARIPRLGVRNVPFPIAHLRCRAIVHVRQSTRTQVMANPESQRRQYGPVGMARGYGFTSIVND